MSDLRIDKWLWAVRIFKTRSKASDACKKGRIIIDDVAVKPSRIVKLNETVHVRINPITKTFIVKGLLHNRLSAKLVQDYVEDITPKEEIDKLKTIRENTPIFFSSKGQGRPTKKDRRMIDKFNKMGS
jgi:ribosome-associated heat shock protein Hsp15